MQIQNPFKRPSVAQVHAESLETARYEMAQHRAAFEFHAAMIVMYQARITRIAGETSGAPQ